MGDLGVVGIFKSNSPDSSKKKGLEQNISARVAEQSCRQNQPGMET